MVTDLRAMQLCTDVGPADAACGTPTRLLTADPDCPPTRRLMDWRGFHTALQRAAIVAAQTGAPLSLLMLERIETDRVDQLRGAEGAATAVAALAGAVRAALGECGVLARLSEERLAVVLIDTDLGGAIGKAERIADQVSLPSWLAGRSETAPRAAIGIAQFQDDESLGHLIQWTAEALRHAKTYRGLAVVADHTAGKRPTRLLRPVRFA